MLRAHEPRTRLQRAKKMLISPAKVSGLLALGSTLPEALATELVLQKMNLNSIVNPREFVWI